MQTPDLSVLREFAQALVRQAPRHSLSRVAASTLRVLAHEGPQRITVLADREVVSQPAMTNLVQRLEAQEFVTRSTDPDDSRAFRIAITDAGREVLLHREKVIDDQLAATFHQLSDTQQAALAAALPALTEFTRIHDFQH